MTCGASTGRQLSNSTRHRATRLVVQDEVFHVVVFPTDAAVATVVSLVNLVVTELVKFVVIVWVESVATVVEGVLSGGR